MTRSTIPASTRGRAVLLLVALAVGACAASMVAAPGLVLPVLGAGLLSGLAGLAARREARIRRRAATPYPPAHDEDGSR